MFYPSEGDFCSEADLQTLVPFFYNSNLLPNKDLLMGRSGIDANRWWLLTRAREWQREKTPKLVSTEFGNSTSFAFDLTGEFVVERGNMWKLKHREMRNVYYAYLAIFRSQMMNRLLAMYSKTAYGRGMVCIK